MNWIQRRLLRWMMGRIISMETFRHYSRYVVNLLAFIVAVLALPEFGALIPAAWLPQIVVVAAAINTILSWLRGLV